MGKKSLILLLTLFWGVVAFAQSTTVRGTVTDSSTGEGIPFASVMVKGTMTGTSTDADGNYSLSVPATGTLVFSSVGYVTTEIALSTRAVYNVALDPDAVSLDQVVVTAPGR